MSRLRTASLAALFLATAFAPAAAQAGWLTQASSVFTTARDVQKHPGKLDQVIVLTSAISGAKGCVAYANDTTEKGDKGKVRTVIVIQKRDGTIVKVRMTATVRNDAAMACRNLPSLRSGAVLTFRNKFKQMPRLRTTAAGAQSAAVSNFISTMGVPTMAEGPLVLLPDAATQPLGLLEGNKEGWFHSTNSVVHVQSGNVSHPGTALHAIVAPTETGARPLICSAYNRSAGIGGRGSVLTKARIARADGSVERLRFEGGIGGETFLRCKNAKKKIRPGDVVFFESKFTGMSDLPAGSFADFIGAIAASGRPDFGAGPPPPPEPEPPVESGEEEEEKEDPEDEPDQTGGGGGGGSTPPPPPPPPPSGGGGGGLSSADELAVSLILDGTKRQLHLVKNASPARFAVIGERTRLKNNGDVDERTMGFGNTIASAVNDYERKVGSMSGNKRRLRSGEISALRYFISLETSGPTAIRKNSRGQFYGDVYRRRLGKQIGGPFSSLERTISWMKSIGL